MSAALLAATNKVLKAVSEDTDLFHAEGYEGVAAFVKAFGGTVPAKKAAAAAPKKEEAAKKGSAAGEVSDDDRDDEDNFWRVEAGQTAASATPNFIDPREKAKAGEPTPEEEEQAMNVKAEAAELYSEGKADEAIAKMTEALTLAPAKAMYWALRADYYLKQKQGLAAVHDADVALSLNSENARALRVRGEVFRHMHKWEESARDLNAAQRVDFNDSVDAMLKFVQPRANARRDRRRHAELKAEEDRRAELLAKQEELRQQRQREQEEEAAAEAAARQQAGGMPGGFPGGMGGMPGMGGMGGMPGMPPGMESLFSDPDIMAAMQDPETAAKLQMLMSNPMAAMGMMGDPKIGPIIQKMMMKMGGGMGGGMPGMGGMGGMGGGAGRAASGAEDLD